MVNVINVLVFIGWVAALLISFNSSKRPSVVLIGRDALAVVLSVTGIVVDAFAGASSLIWALDIVLVVGWIASFLMRLLCLV